MAQNRERMEDELIAGDKALPRDKLLALATLLKEARRIEHDLTGRLSQRPEEKFLVRQHKEYQRLVGQLTWEVERALDCYLARFKAPAGPGARTAITPSGRASASSRPAGRHTPAR